MNTDSMLKLLLVSPDRISLSDLETAFMEYHDVELLRARGGQNALDLLSNTPVDLVIGDEDLGDMSGLDFAARLLRLNPMIPCALVSDLSPVKFHEVSEGLGLVAQIPAGSGKRDAEDILMKLKRIKDLMSGGRP